jgi:hypothetical protein
VLAARQVFPDALVQLVHLVDQEIFSIHLSGKQLENRRKSSTIPCRYPHWWLSNQPFASDLPQPTSAGSRTRSWKIGRS